MLTYGLSLLLLFILFIYLFRDTPVSLETSMLIKQMIELDPSKRLTASSTCDTVQNILSRL